MPSAQHSMRPELTGQLRLNAHALNLLDHGLQYCIDWGRDAGLLRDPTMEEMTTRANGSLRRAFINWVAVLGQELGINMPTTYEKDKKIELTPGVKIDRRMAIQKALKEHIGASSSRRGPRPALRGVTIL